MTSSVSMAGEVELADWRRQVCELYASVRQSPDPQLAHLPWRSGRDRLFQEHSQSPLSPEDPLRAGLRYAAYDPALRWQLAVQYATSDQRARIETGPGERTDLRLVGHLNLPAPIHARIGVWWLEQYGGGLFIPIRDRTAGSTSYGGGRYLIDTTKGADLGSRHGSVTADLNFLYHPSCRYDPQWQCPLAHPQNTIAAPIHAASSSRCHARARCRHDEGRRSFGRVGRGPPTRVRGHRPRVTRAHAYRTRPPNQPPGTAQRETGSGSSAAR